MRIILQDGVILGADTRSTSDTTVADKNCEKIHYIAPNIYCCGAGTAADTENVTGARARCTVHARSSKPGMLHALQAWRGTPDSVTAARLRAQTTHTSRLACQSGSCMRRVPTGHMIANTD